MKFLLSLFFFFFSSLSFSFADLTESQQRRAESLFHELRCVVCQNQSIADSNADIAQDLRHLVRQEIRLGKSDDEIKSFLVSRYGDFILLRPRFTASTSLLWLSPLIILLSASLFLFYAYRRR